MAAKATNPFSSVNKAASGQVVDLSIYGSTTPFSVVPRRELGRWQSELDVVLGSVSPIPRTRAPAHPQAGEARATLAHAAVPRVTNISCNFRQHARVANLPPRERAPRDQKTTPAGLISEVSSH